MRNPNVVYNTLKLLTTSTIHVTVESNSDNPHEDWDTDSGDKETNRSSQNTNTGDESSSSKKNWKQQQEDARNKEREEQKEGLIKRTSQSQFF